MDDTLCFMLCYALLQTNDISTKENNLSEVESSYVNINSLRYDALWYRYVLATIRNHLEQKGFKNL